MTSKKKKILIVQLLRIGDIISSLPIIVHLHKKYPDIEIDLLINKETRFFVPLLPAFIKIIFFDRKVLQAGLGEVDRGFFESYDLLNGLVQKLNENKYNQVVNLTQNKLSGWLVGLIQSPKKVGMNIFLSNISGKMRSEVTFNSPWLEYLNSKKSVAETRFHYTDIFQKSLGLTTKRNKDNVVVDYGIIENEVGINEAQELLFGIDEFIAVQLFTSDLQKNWQLDSYKIFFEQMKVFAPKMKFLLLGAESERIRIEDFISDCNNPSLIPAVCSFSGAYSLLKRSKLLLTGDTSIKHLACASKTPMIEMCLGPSDYKSYGGYCSDNIIVCPKDKNIPSELITLLVQGILNKDERLFLSAAKNYQNSTKVMKTKFLRTSENDCWWSFEEINSLETKIKNEQEKIWNDLSSCLEKDGIGEIDI